MNCYDYPQYWDLAFSDETEIEADFIEAAAAKYSKIPIVRLYEPGCGGGRLVVELASRGYEICACDLSEAAIEHAALRLKQRSLTADLHVADMTEFRPPAPVDLAFNTVNTFRHLLSEEAARAHLQCVADALPVGGLYVLGLHLLPPDADEEDSEQWSVAGDDVTVTMYLEVLSCSRESRLEDIRFQLDVRDGDRQVKLETTYTLRIYLAEQMHQLLTRVPTFEVCGVFDFCYEIDRPLALNDDLGDTVLILRKR